MQLRLLDDPLRRTGAISPYKKEKNNDAKQDGSNACSLRVGHAEERTRIQADELDKKTRHARENEIGAKNQTC